MSDTRRGAKLYTFGEELLNSISHGLGALLSIAGTVILIVFTSLNCDAWAIVSVSIYGFSLIVLYTMSTLYHALTNEKAKRVFRALDHCTIFLLIAGTYTPYSLVTLRGTMGWIVFGLVWGSAVVGTTLSAISVEKFKKINLILYIVSGWTAVIVFVPLFQKLPMGGLFLMVLGGIFYTSGIIFYKRKDILYFHGVWHFFVLAGSICHYFSILNYVLK